MKGDKADSALFKGWIFVRKFLILALLAAVFSGSSVMLNAAAETGQTIFINELMASNTSTIRDGDSDDSQGGAYSDWIEIYNAGSQSINLRGYTLSDSSTAWTFPDAVVPAGGFLLVWASDKNKVAKDGQLHTNFKLSSSGETVTLKKPDGIEVDSVNTVSLGNDQSYGRSTDGAVGFSVFSRATPCNPNILGQAKIETPVFSHKAGFYTGAFNLILSANRPDARIYYTKDGSDPVPGKPGTMEYTTPIGIKSRAGDPNLLSMIRNITNDTYNPWKEPAGEVFKCSIIKAVSVGEDGAISKVAANSYFVDPDIGSRYNLPVISLVTDNENLFDDAKGIYVNGNYTKEGEEWERPMHIEFFEKDGTPGFSQYCGARIHGNATRSFPQKSFRLYADKEYDDNNEFKYEIFPGLEKEVNDKSIKSFKRLILRNAGNDWTSAMLRDEFIQSLFSGIKTLDTQAYRSSVVFLNGEYWGIYHIRERYDDEYLESHYNLDKKKVAILDVFEKVEIQKGTQEDADAYTNDIVNYLKTHSITEQSTYDYIKTKMDIENYIDYNIAHIFSGNIDWPGNNVSIWRYRTGDGRYHPEAPYGQDGRWRWFLKDTDYGFGLYGSSVTRNTLSFAASEKQETYANPEWSTFVFRTLLKNTDFRNEFINRFADRMNTVFEPTRVLDVLNGAAAAMQPEIQENYDRWQKISYNFWCQLVEEIRTYAKERPANVRQHIESQFAGSGVTGTVSVKLNSDPARGYIKINSIDIKATPGVTSPDAWTGNYFKGVPVTVKAIPEAGYTFDHWIGVPENLAVSDTITFTPSEDVDIAAVFKSEGYKLSGYVNADFTSKAPDIKAGFKVEIMDMDRQMSALTDSNGYFEIKNVPPSTTGYTISIRKANYLYRELKNVVVLHDKSLSEKDSPILMWAGDISVAGVQDGAINMTDIMGIARAFNSSPGDGRYNADCDLNKDNAVNMSDIMIVAKHFNTTSLNYK